MTTLELADEEFGPILIRLNPRARRVILRVRPDTTVHITMPHKRYLSTAQSLLRDARPRIRLQRSQLQQSAPEYAPGSLVGRNHQLVFQAQAITRPTTRVSEDKIIVKYPFELTPDHPDVQEKVREAVKKALRRQAEAFLPPRLARLANAWGFSYSEVRITSGRTRWGSCSSSGTISLNLALMALPDHLIDYVICHELCHTREHNHSPAFWNLVATFTPNWRELRKTLKESHPF